MRRSAAVLLEITPREGGVAANSWQPKDACWQLALLLLLLLLALFHHRHQSVLYCRRRFGRLEA
jgi:hypothetical protein